VGLQVIADRGEQLVRERRIADSDLAFDERRRDPVRVGVQRVDDGHRGSKEVGRRGVEHAVTHRVQIGEDRGEALVQGADLGPDLGAARRVTRVVDALGNQR
jgi:hypothetical protein